MTSTRRFSARHFCLAALLLAVMTAPASAQSITIISPQAGEQVNYLSTDYHVRWSASDIPGNAQFVVTRINGAGEEVTICHAAPAERNCHWFEPDPYTSALFVQATNSSGAVLVRVQADPFEVVAGGPAPNLRSMDIGDVGRSGSLWGTGDASVRVRGAGGDIWGTADAFHYAWFEVRNPSDATFTIADVDGTHRWTKVGVMMRENSLPGSPHHSIFATKSMGLAYQRRLVQNGESLHTSLSPNSGLPVTVQVMRRSDIVVIDYRQGDGPWQTAAWLPGQVEPMLGMAVTSHDTSVIATGEFTGVTTAYEYPATVEIYSPWPGVGDDEITAGVPYTISWGHTQPVNTATVSYSVDDGRTWTVVPGCQSIDRTTCLWENPGPATESARVRVVIEDPNDRTAWNVTWRFAIRDSSGGALPVGWANYDVGNVGAPGSAAYDPIANQFTVEGAGADIWGTSDAFHVARFQLSRGLNNEDHFTVTARVTSVENTHRWTKAGIMVRTGSGAGAAHAFLLATPTTEKGIAFQRRPTEGGLSVHTAGPAVAPPVWLKLVVRQNLVRAYYRHLTTDPWTFLAEDHIAFTGSVFDVGLVVSSHRHGVLARATFDNVSIGPTQGLRGGDIGAVGAPGSTQTDGVTWTIRGSGADIWGTADAFHYAFGSSQPFGGRAVVSARVLSLAHTHRWAKAGVMFREDSSPGARHVMLIVSAERGIAMQYRDTIGGITRDVAIVPGAAPVWLRLQRYASVFVGEASTDGHTWWEVGRVEIPMIEEILSAGLAVTSHNNGVLTTAVFDDVLIRP